MVTYFKDQVSQIVGDGVDLLFCNEQEADSDRQRVYRRGINHAVEDSDPMGLYTRQRWRICV